MYLSNLSRKPSNNDFIEIINNDTDNSNIESCNYIFLKNHLKEMTSTKSLYELNRWYFHTDTRGKIVQINSMPFSNEELEIDILGTEVVVARINWKSPIPFNVPTFELRDKNPSNHIQKIFGNLFTIINNDLKALHRKEVNK